MCCDVCEAWVHFQCAGVTDSIGDPDPAIAPTGSSLTRTVPSTASVTNATVQRAENPLFLACLR